MFALTLAAASIHISLVGIVIGVVLAAIVYFVLAMFLPHPIPALVALLIFVVCAFDLAACC